MSEYAEWGWAVRDSAKFRALYSSPSFNLALGQQHTEVSSQGEGQGTRRLSSAVPGPGRMEKGVIESSQGDSKGHFSTRQEELVLPWHLKWVPPILELLPLGLRDALLDVAGAASAMGGFRGRGAAQWEQMSGSVG